MLWWRGWSKDEKAREQWRGRIRACRDGLANTELNYGAPGLIDREEIPRGYRQRQWRERVGNGEASFRGAWSALSSGRMHTAAGLTVIPDPVELTTDTSFATQLTVGPIAIVNPCRVISVLDEPLQCGITYGTLTGHILQGEEQFVLELESGGTVWLTITAISRPDAFYARLGPLFVRQAQAGMAERYIRALQAVAKD